MGPVQVLVVGFDPPAFSGEVLAELGRLREAGIVRLVDLLLVERAEDGSLQTLDPPGANDRGFGTLAAAVLGSEADKTDATMPDAAMPDATQRVDADAALWSLADAVPAGSVAAVALIEHLWAGPLTDAIGRAGGTTLEETWL